MLRDAIQGTDQPVEVHRTPKSALAQIECFRHPANESKEPILAGVGLGKLAREIVVIQVDGCLLVRGPSTNKMISSAENSTGRIRRIWVGVKMRCSVQ